MRLTRLLAPLVLLQVLLGLRVLRRLIGTARGVSIAPVPPGAPLAERVSVILPVLNERERLLPCLEGLTAQGPEVAEILVVDGGSVDGTQQIVDRVARDDARVRLIDASPIPDNWNGKAWGLHSGMSHADPACGWLLTIDADVRPAPLLVRSLLVHAGAFDLSVLSVATRQEIAGLGQGILHPALLTTLVYRFGIPGSTTRNPSQIQANGQCFLARREALEGVGGFASVADSICEDVTLARRLATQGYPVGFFEAGGLVSVRMYPDWRSTWRGWTRSLPMRDRYSGRGIWVGLLEVLLVQALPIPLLAALRLANAPRWTLAVNSVLASMRIGVLVGTARAYATRPWSYWLSPLVDLPSAIKLFENALRRRHVWRGRPLVRGGQ